MPKKCICRELSLSNPTEFYGHFIFTSLNHGEGITLGNMVRRTLLSSLSGSKIVGVKMSNVNHEFSDVEGIREDILEIFLNLKEVIIKNPLNYSVCYGKVNIHGPAIITAGLISLPKNISILNPEQYLFTISEQIHVEIEVKIECGKSYILATDRKLDDGGEFFPIDANFTPILNVEYHIQPVVDFAEKSREELHMIISTNGTLLPQEALLIASNNLSQLILGCREIEIIKSQKSFIGITQPNVKNQLIKNILDKEKSVNKNLDGFLLKNVIQEQKLEKPIGRSLSKNQKENLIIKTNKVIDKPTKVDLLKKEKPSQFTTKDRNQQILKNDKNLSTIAKEKKVNQEQVFISNERQSNKFLLSDKYLTKLSKATHGTKNLNIIHTPTKTLDLRTIDIEITCLPLRILTTLKKEKINYMSDLLEYSSLELQKLKGLGPVSVKKIKDQVELFFEAISL